MTETTLTQLTDHCYWMSPGKPDRPSLGAVVGDQFTLLLDAGASAAHAQLQGLLVERPFQRDLLGQATAAPQLEQVRRVLVADGPEPLGQRLDGIILVCFSVFII